MKLDKLIDERKAVIGVIGLGYVGLPLARIFCKGGFSLIGFDIDPQKVKYLKEGKSYIGHIPSQDIRDMISSERFRPTGDFTLLRDCDAIIICVPTPLTLAREPDLSFLTSTATEIGNHLRNEQLVIVESTTYPGTTDEIVLPILEKSGLKCERDFFLAYSPEREDPGNPNFSTSNIPKVVGGIGKRSLELACKLYSTVVVGVVPVSSTRIAEATKMLENIYRAVNIALVNEMKVTFMKMGIDIWEVIDAASTKPFGFQTFYPGPGLGGHCIPIDPFYLSWKARTYGAQTKFIELAGEINTAMPDYVVSRVAGALNSRGKPVRGAKILLLGVAYKKDVDDIRESPALKIMEILTDMGASIAYYDPHVPAIPKISPMRRFKLSMKSKPLTASLLAEQDCVLITTAHSVIDYDFVVEHASLVVDTRNATRNVKNHRERIVMA